MPATGNCALSRTVMVLLAACMMVFLQAVPLHAQQRSKSKLPIIGKLTSGNHQQAFTGKIQSLDLKQRVLNVNALHGQDMEIFPVRKSVHVQGVNGQKMKLKELVPGMTVLIYYNQKPGERAVKDIIVLSSGKSQGKAKPAESS
ncbi:MAG: hypothetical protein P8Z30_16625 [Acidobacteriota bacterium]